MTLSDDQRHPRPATVVVSEAPNVTVEQAADHANADADGDRVFIDGTMAHSGLNRNAWGLTEDGAAAVAETLRDGDVTASHPPIRDGRYDRSMHGGQGAPIGRVTTTEVTTADTAMLSGGGYTAKYTAEILDPTAKAQFKAGLRTGENYGVSIGIYGNPEDAVCSVCRDPMDACDHDRFQEVEVEGDDTGGTEAHTHDHDEDGDGETETQIAGPLYNDAVADHLASVYLPAYDGATVSVGAAQAQSGVAQSATDADRAAAGLSGHGVPEAATQLGGPFDATDDAPDGEAEAETATDTGPDTASDAFRVRVGADSADDYHIRF